MKAWRRTSRMASTGLAAATVIRVLTDGSANVEWDFSTPISSIDTTDGMTLNGGEIGALVSIVGPTVTINYATPRSPGESWELDVTQTHIVFTNGASIASATGTDV